MTLRLHGGHRGRLLNEGPRPDPLQPSLKQR